MEMKDKIKMLRQQHNLTLEEVGNAVGVGKSTVRKWENGDIANMRRDKIAKLASVLHTTPGYLMGWDDNGLTILPKNIIPIPKMKKIPLIGDIACGTPILAVQNIQDYIDEPEHVNADFALRCEGDSMINARIMNGDIVYIHQQPTIENGEIAAVLIGEEATLKRVYINMDRIVLQPENPAFEPFIYVGAEMADVHIIGKAVAFVSTVK